MYIYTMNNIYLKIKFDKILNIEGLVNADSMTMSYTNDANADVINDMLLAIYPLSTQINILNESVGGFRSNTSFIFEMRNNGIFEKMLTENISVEYVQIQTFRNDVLTQVGKLSVKSVDQDLNKLKITCNNFIENSLFNRADKRPIFSGNINKSMIANRYTSVLSRDKFSVIGQNDLSIIPIYSNKGDWFVDYVGNSTEKSESISDTSNRFFYKNKQGTTSDPKFNYSLKYNLPIENLEYSTQYDPSNQGFKDFNIKGFNTILFKKTVIDDLGFTVLDLQNYFNARIKNVCTIDSNYQIKKIYPLTGKIKLLTYLDNVEIFIDISVKNGELKTGDNLFFLGGDLLGHIYDFATDLSGVLSFENNDNNNLQVLNFATSYPDTYNNLLIKSNQKCNDVIKKTVTSCSAFEVDFDKTFYQEPIGNIKDGKYYSSNNNLIFEVGQFTSSNGSNFNNALDSTNINGIFKAPINFKTGYTTDDQIDVIKIRCPLKINKDIAFSTLR